MCSVGLGLSVLYVRFGSLTVPQTERSATWPIHFWPEGDVARKRTKNQAPTPAGKARSDINDVAGLA